MASEKLYRNTLNITYFTLMEDGDFPLTQCAAVTTQ